jgi:hypothetical protein
LTGEVPQELLFEEICSEFKSRDRKFAVGVAMAFIDFLLDIGAVGTGIKDYNEFLKKFPRQEMDSKGKRRNTLVVKLPDGKTRSIRPYYNAVELLIRATHHRLGYPSAAPHATQSWPDYTQWIGKMASATPAELQQLRQKLLDFVLEALPSHAIDPKTITKTVPLFLKILEEFEFRAQKGEPTGAAFQGAVFAYLRADAPHLQVEVRKVRTGSKRVGMIGDIDAWDGDRLIISAEAKHYRLKPSDVDELTNFSSSITLRKALGLVVAEEFEPEARAQIEKIGLVALSLGKLIGIVRLWDPLKQKIAAQAFLYYASHVEQDSSLANRIRKFIVSADPTGATTDETPSSV